MSEPMMVELVPGAWVRPDQVAAIWNESDDVMSIQFVGGGDMRRFHKDAPLADIVARLAPKWEQPPNPDDGDGLTEIRNMHGVVRRIVRPTDSVEPQDVRTMMGGRDLIDPSGADVTAKRGGLRWVNPPFDGTTQPDRLPPDRDWAAPLHEQIGWVRPDAPGDQKLWYRE